MRGWHRYSLLIGGVLLLFWVSISWIPPVRFSNSAYPESSLETPHAGENFATFLSRHPDTRLLDGEELERAVALAKERRDWMKKTMASDPATALRFAVSRSVRAGLHAEIQPFFEERFNSTGDLLVYPICGAGITERVVEFDGRGYTGHVFGQRLLQPSRENAPMHGITLDGEAVVAEFAIEKPPLEDKGLLSVLPLGNQNATRDFFTGRLLGESPVTILAGGTRYLVRADTDLEEINRRLAGLDSQPGPRSGSAMAFALQSGAGNGTSSIVWEIIEQQARELASAWTESPKRVFFICVDFSDAPAEGPTPADLGSRLNGAVASVLRDMSYGKTTLNATVAPQVLRMAKLSTDYKPSGSTALRDDAMAAYKAVHGQSSLDGYDIVGVQFPSIGLTSGGVVWSGLASVGGSRQYLQGNIGDGTIIHEFGHNYGLYHASFWKTSDGSVAGAGQSVEYGDPFDIMGGGDPPWGHFHMRAKQRLNWLGAANWADLAVTGSGTYRLHRFDHPQTSGSLRALRVPMAASASESYWLGYRAGVPNNDFLQNGAYILWARPGESQEWLLDSTPSSADGPADAPIGIGKTYSDAQADIHITPVAKGGSGADSWLDVRVNQGPFPGNQPPQASLQAPSVVQARSATTLSVAASDPNGDVLAYGWSVGNPPVHVNAAQISQTWTTGGNRTIEVAVSDMKGGVSRQSQAVQVIDPLDDWTATTVAPGRAMGEAAYLNGRFLLGGDGYIYTSLDGSNWQQTNVALNYRPEGFSLAGTVFVAVGYDWNGAWAGVVHTSPDGVIWTQSTGVGSVPELRAVASGNGVLVAVGDDGVILRSVDAGATWTRQDIPGSSTSLTSVVFGDGVFLCAGGLSVWSSTDGLTWMDRSSGIGISSWKTPIRALHYYHGRFIAGGWYSLLYSTDAGQTWQEAVVTGGADYDVRSIASDEGVVVAAADRRTSPAGNVLLVSTDGIHWEESQGTGLPGTLALATGGGRFFTATGTAGAMLSSALLDPANQAPVISVSAAASGGARLPLAFSASASDPDGDPILIIWDFNDGSALRHGAAVTHSFATAGSYNISVTATDQRGGVSTAIHAISVPDPLANWTTRNSTTTAELFDIVHAGGKLVAVGGSSGTYCVSTNGVAWTKGSIASNVTLRGVVHDGTQFVAVGDNYDWGTSSWKGTVYTSSNGSSWTNRLFAGAQLRDVAYGNGRLVAVGMAGAAWSSSNGTAWSPVSTGTSSDLLSIAYGNGRFVAVGSGSSGSTVLVSEDGSEWLDRSAGVDLDDWRETETVVYSGERFFSSGWYVGIRQSLDAGQSFRVAVDADWDMQAFAHGNGIHFAAGIDQANGNADKSVISTDGASWFEIATESVPDRHAAVFFQNTFLTVGKSGSIRQSDPFTAPPGGGYAAWLEAWFGENPPFSAPGEDFDGDGYPNLMEYAAGTDPKAWTSASLSVAELVNGHLHLWFGKDPAIEDVSVTAQQSGDLINWFATGFTPVRSDATGLEVLLSTPVHLTPGGRSFVRWRFDLR